MATLDLELMFASLSLYFSYAILFHLFQIRAALRHQLWPVRHPLHLQRKGWRRKRGGSERPGEVQEDHPGGRQREGEGQGGRGGHGGGRDHLRLFNSVHVVLLLLLHTVWFYVPMRFTVELVANATFYDLLFKIIHCDSQQLTVERNKEVDRVL